MSVRPAFVGVVCWPESVVGCETSGLLLESMRGCWLSVEMVRFEPAIVREGSEVVGSSFVASVMIFVGRSESLLWDPSVVKSTAMEDLLVRLTS